MKSNIRRVQLGETNCVHNVSLDENCTECDNEVAIDPFEKYTQYAKELRGDDKKHDKGKLMWDLLPWKQVEKIVDILTFGASKYGPNQWQTVEDGKDRYFAAMMRHITAWWGGERNDPESGKHHLAHAGCCLLFLMWLDDREPVMIKCIKCWEKTDHSLVGKPEIGEAWQCNVCGHLSDEAINGRT
jgi:DNA-directed RNA polymerase subunit RPC12/RpoP